MIYFENKNRNKMGSAPISRLLDGIKNGFRYNCTITLSRTHKFHSFKLKDVITKNVVEAIRTGDFSKLPLDKGFYLELTDNKPKFHSNLPPPEITTLDLKDALPCIVFSVNNYNPGMDKYKPKSKIEDINTLSGYICIDIDKLLPEDIAQYKHEIFMTFYFVKAIFTSPSGNGLKVIIKYNDTSNFLNDSEVKDDIFMRKDVYHKLNMNLFDEIYEKTGIKCDPDAIDMNRLCFISYDPDILIREDAEMIPYLFREFNRENKIIKTVKNYKSEIKTQRSRETEQVIKEGDGAKFINDVRFFIEQMKSKNIRPFADSDYNSVIYFIMGMVDAANVFDIDKNTTYDLVYQVISQDSYYGNHKGEGESFIQARFENIWNRYNPLREDRRTYKSVINLMKRILHV